MSFTSYDFSEDQKLLGNRAESNASKFAYRKSVFKISAPNIFEKQNSKLSKGYGVDLWTQRNQNSQLLTAIYNNDYEKVVTCVEQGAEPNTTCRTYKFTALHLAILCANIQIIKYLIDRGANVTAVDKNGLTALHYAAWFNKHQYIDILLSELDENERSTFVNKQAKEVCVQVKEHWKDALDHTCGECVDLFVIEFEKNATALHLACQLINHTFVKKLLQYNPDLKIEDERELTAFEVIGEHLSSIEIGKGIAENFIEIVKLMSSNMASYEVLKKEVSYFSPVHAAVILHSQESINLLKDNYFPLIILDKYGQTPIHLAIIKQSEKSLIALLECIEDISAIRNSAGMTPFQTAVEYQWIQGVGLLLNSNANVAEVAADGRTILHVAAAVGNVEFLEELLELDQVDEIIDSRNNLGETPIFCAVSSGSLDCVNALIEKSVDINFKLEGNISIIYRAAELGNVEILAALLKYQTDEKLKLIDEADNLTYSGMTPLQIAACNDNVECVQELLDWKCNYKLRTGSVLYRGGLAVHLAAAKGSADVIEVLIHYDNNLLWMTDHDNRTALYCAAERGHRNCIDILLKAGADLSCNINGETCLDVIYRNISRPTEFLETIFDKFIRIDDKSTLITDQNCLIKINFNVLIPKHSMINQMGILSNILFNGKSLDQRKLLLHPLIESFLYLKWNKMKKIFWLLIFIYAVFVSCLTVFVLSIFYYTDENRPYILSDIEFSRFALIASLLTVIIPELLLIQRKLQQYTINTERTIKWSSIILVAVLTFVNPKDGKHDWLRHLATIALLTAWIEIMFMLSKVPTWGYYVQMFFKVSKNVMKVMTVFSFLVIGFALAFLIEFQSTEPFTSPLGGFIKTIVMMTAELDYSGLFTGENIENMKVITLIIYVLFLMMGTIVLMNLLIGLAVSDIHNLELIGKIDRHAQQIVFLSMLESDTLSRFLPNKIKAKFIDEKCIPCNLKIYPSSPHCYVTKLLPGSLKDNIIDIAEDNVRRESDITNIQLSNKLNDMIKMIEKLQEDIQHIKKK